jgi:tetratricopeptide (TPR) repeat protein
MFMFGALFSRQTKHWERECVRNPVKSYDDAVSLLKDHMQSNKPTIHKYYQEAADCLDIVFAKVPELREDRSLHQGYPNIMIQHFMSEDLARPNKLLGAASKAFVRKLKADPIQFPQPARDIVAYLLWFSSLGTMITTDPAATGDIENLVQLRKALELSVALNEDNAAAHADLAYVMGTILEFTNPNEADISQGLRHCDRSLQLWEKNPSAYRVMSVLYILRGDKIRAREAFRKATVIAPNLPLRDRIDAKINSMN